MIANILLIITGVVLILFSDQYILGTLLVAWGVLSEEIKANRR